VGLLHQRRDAAGARLYASDSFFDGLGVHAQVGRVFNDADDQPGCATPPAVLSSTTWRSRYAGDAGIVGRTISLNRPPACARGFLSPTG
jgi:hypothetical protein